MIIGGQNKRKIEFYLVKKPQFNLISKKEVLKKIKKLIKALKGYINFLPLITKEKSLYNTAFIKTLKTGGVSIGELSR